MLLDNPTLEGIVAGHISVVFRTWQKPTVKTGGTLRTRRGVLAIQSLEAIQVRQITADDVRAAGFKERSELLRGLEGRSGTLYRIRVKLQGEDPRIALRQRVLDASEREAMAKRLARMDAASSDGPWTHAYLETIAARPAQRAPELAELFGLETKPFKQRVRRLKELGLTESLKVGYRLSPRGQSYLQAQPRTPAADGGKNASLAARKSSAARRARSKR
jgi:hypothetical protein